jgi:hypothetical protein
MEYCDWQHFKANRLFTEQAGVMEEALVKDRQFVWRAADVLKLYLYIGVLIVAFAKCPNNIWDGAAGHIIVVLGTLGTWRYSWWFTHFIRAQIYQRSVFPRTRRKADRLWNSGCQSVSTS